MCKDQAPWCDTAPWSFSKNLWWNQNSSKAHHPLKIQSSSFRAYFAYTVSLTWAVTSGWSLISAMYSPISRISGTVTRRLSTSLLSCDFMMSTRSCAVTLPNICFPFPPLRGTLNAPIVSKTRASCCASSFTYSSTNAQQGKIMLTLDESSYTLMENDIGRNKSCFRLFTK